MWSVVRFWACAGEGLGALLGAEFKKDFISDPLDPVYHISSMDLINYCFSHSSRNNALQLVQGSK